jgi:hypothetical protein
MSAYLDPADIARSDAGIFDAISQSFLLRGNPE